MPRNTEKWSEARIEEELTESYLLGIATTNEDAAAFLRQESGHAFAHRNYDRAKFCQEYEDKFLERAKLARKKHAEQKERAESTK